MRFEAHKRARVAFKGASEIVFTAKGRFGNDYIVDENVKGWRLIVCNQFGSKTSGYLFIKCAHAKQAARDMEIGNFKEKSAISRISFS